MFHAWPRDRRDIWLPGLVGLVGVLLSLAGWGVLIADRRAQTLRAARDTAAEIRDAIELGLDQQVVALQGLTELWQKYGLRPPAEWSAIVGQRVEQLPGVLSVTRIDLDDRHGEITAGAARTSDEAELDLEEARLHYPDRVLSGPERDTSGRLVYRIFMPAWTPEGHPGVLVARVHVAPFLESVLRARARGYAISVFWQGEPIYARGQPSEDAWQRWWRVEETVALPLGGQWRVVHRPTRALAAARLTPIPHYLLAAGLLLSIVIAVVVHQLRVNVRQSRFLAATNRALEQRGLELESKVAERTQALEEAVTELEAFNYSVSHDLRSPLSAILNFTAILEEDYRSRPLDEEAVSILDRISRSASRATALLEDLLQLSRAGRASLTFEPIDMTALARETFAQVREARHGDDEDVELQVDPLPEAVGDRTLLGDVFANLFSNALKYSRGREKRRVHVSGRELADECIYDVVDNGQGFDMRFVEKIFGLFERLHAAPDVEGTGIGLAMVARIVKRHGGSVSAEGWPDEGARFSFTLPRREVT